MLCPLLKKQDANSAQQDVMKSGPSLIQLGAADFLIQAIPVGPPLASTFFFIGPR